VASEPYKTHNADRPLIMRTGFVTGPGLQTAAYHPMPIKTYLWYLGRRKASIPSGAKTAVVQSECVALCASREAAAWLKMVYGTGSSSHQLILVLAPPSCSTDIAVSKPS
jgi:hypothetical protein